MRTIRTTALLLSLALLAACDEASSPLSRETPRLNHVVGTACDAGLATQIYASIDLIFSGQQRAKARNAFGDVEKYCTSNPARAKRALMAYVKYTIAQKQHINASSSVHDLAGNWDMSFVFAGYDAPSHALPSGAQLGLALTSSGAAGVFRDGRLVTLSGFAGIDAGLGQDGKPYQGDPAERLWLIVPITCPSGAGLFPLCFDFSVHPNDDVNSQVVQGALCPAGEGLPYHPRLEFAHESENAQATFQNKLPKRASSFLTGCHDVAGLDPDQAWWQYAANEEGAMSRLASAVFEFFAPRQLYALHGGLSGTTDTRSGSFSGTPYGGVDPAVFADAFQNDVVGQEPASPDIGEESGGSIVEWITEYTHPSSITVQASLGDINSNLVVIDQKGGNSTNSDSLIFYARTLAPPNTGRVGIRWQGVISTPTVIAAPIFIRTYDGTGIVAKVEYRRGAGAQSGPVFLNGVQVPGVTWNRNVSQYFDVIVDFSTGKVGIRVSGTGWSETAPLNLSGLSFVDAAADNVGRFGVEMGGQDNEILGLDRITINRLPDATLP